MNQTKAASAAAGGKAVMSGGALLVIGIAVVIVVVAGFLLASSTGKASGSAGNGGTNSTGYASGSDAIAQAFASNQTLTGAQLANITEQYSKSVGPMNITYKGKISGNTNSGNNFTTSLSNRYNETYMHENGDFVADMLLSSTDRIHNPYYSNNVTALTHSITIGFSNMTSYSCSDILNITPPDPQVIGKGFSCIKGSYLNSTLFNFSNQFGSTPYVKYHLVGKSSVIGIPCDELAGTGALNSSTANIPISISVNITTCVSFKYMAWLSYNMSFRQTSSAYNFTSISTTTGTATALNNNVPANFTQLPQNAILISSRQG